MATPSMDITSFVGKLLEQDDVDALREDVRVLAQAVMETEVSGQIGAGPYERSTERTAYRNGYRTRLSSPRGRSGMRLDELALTLRDVDLGGLDAESDHKLAAHFVTTPHVEYALAGRRTLFLGRKGSGKSALFRQLPCPMAELQRPLSSS